MRRKARLWAALVIGAAALSAVGAQVGAQAKPALPGQAAQGPAIKWAASFDQALKAMGADEKPVILYFTYDT